MKTGDGGTHLFDLEIIKFGISDSDLRHQRTLPVALFRSQYPEGGNHAGKLLVHYPVVHVIRGELLFLQFVHLGAEFCSQKVGELILCAGYKGNKEDGYNP